MPWGNTTSAPAKSNSSAPLELLKNADNATIKGPGMTAVFDKKRGTLVSWTLNGKPLLSTPLVPNFWRALTDNDIRGGSLRVPPQTPWRDAFRNATLTAFAAKQSTPQTVQVDADYRLAGVEATLAMHYTFDADGQLQVNARLKREKTDPVLPRFGVQLGIPTDFNQATYYGRGHARKLLGPQDGCCFGDVTRQPSIAFPTAMCVHKRTAIAAIVGGSSCVRTTVGRFALRAFPSSTSAFGLTRWKTSTKPSTRPICERPII